MPSNRDSVFVDDEAVAATPAEQPAAVSWPDPSPLDSWWNDIMGLSADPPRPNA
ncbi:hypothetical protein [Nocardia sp. MDA0666]|uniref:hypothetical protein n=1 Tax=Nocardia sp. MDA0666 TaxID=2135448 RepID=UPI001304AA81|nr:hypothetical protein [Nocardia sp. MDA0666]